MIIIPMDANDRYLMQIGERPLIERCVCPICRLGYVPEWMGHRHERQPATVPILRTCWGCYRKIPALGNNTTVALQRIS